MVDCSVCMAHYSYATDVVSSSVRMWNNTRWQDSFSTACAVKHFMHVCCISGSLWHSAGAFTVSSHPALMTFILHWRVSYDRMCVPKPFFNKLWHSQSKFPSNMELHNSLHICMLKTHCYLPLVHTTAPFEYTHWLFCLHTTCSQY